MPSIISIGTATRDVFLRSEKFKAIEDPHFTAESGFPTGKAECLPFGAKLEIEDIVIATGGGATNTAFTFARQGIKTKSLITVGNDPLADEIIRELKSENIEPVVVRNKEHDTAYSTLLLSPSGERTVLVYRGAANDLELSSISKKDLHARWAYIVPGHIPFNTIEKTVNRLYSDGVKIAINPSSAYLEYGADRLALILNKMSVVVLNREEACMLTGIDFNNEVAIFKKLDELVDGVVVMTEGPEGVMVSDGKTLFKAGIFEEKQVADRTGAGDAFGSGFVAGIIGSGDISHDVIKEAIRLGSANATSVVEHVGTKRGILTKEQFENDNRWKKLNIAHYEI